MSKTLIMVGDVILVNLDPVMCKEKNKLRPFVVIVGSGHPWELVIVAPITDALGKRPPQLFVSIPNHAATGLGKLSCIDCFQIRCISEQRVTSKIGKVSESILSEVRHRLAKIFDIGEEHTSI